jgi:molecular chaperone GrpE
MADGEQTATEEEAGAPEAADVEEAAAAVETDIAAALTAERDEYKALAQRIQADFENYKKRVLKQQTEHLERAAEQLVSKLLPVLDTVDLAVAHGGGEAVEQVWLALTDTLGREGLERIDPTGEAFDPQHHEAVLHEPVDDGDDAKDAGPTVSEVLRAGYVWKGRVLRPAMVKVKG